MLLAVFLALTILAACSHKAENDPGPVLPVTRSMMHLENFVLCLDEPTNRTYLRVGIDLGLGRDLKGDRSSVDAATPIVRDTIINVLDNSHADELSNPAGKQKLKRDLLSALQQRIPDLQVREIYFTDFLLEH